MRSNSFCVINFPVCPACNRVFLVTSHLRTLKRKYCSRECYDGPKGTQYNLSTESLIHKKRVLSEIAKKNINGNYGGYKPNGGRGRKGWYRGIFCDSSWELAYVIWCLDHNKIIKRCIEKFQYTYNGKIYNYLPDFVVDQKYTEIKGYKTAQWQAKLTQFPHEIDVLYQQ